MSQQPHPHHFLAAHPPCDVMQKAKELTGKITALKKLVGKGASDKAKKKQVQGQIASLESELAERHRQELEGFKCSGQSAPTGNQEQCGSMADDHEDADAGVGIVLAAEKTIDSTDDVVEGIQDLNLASAENGTNTKPKQSRQARRKERKAEQMEQIRKEAEAEAALAPNLREIERTDIEQLANAMNRVIREISADGHCLYNALADQLHFHQPDSNMTYKNLRKIAAEYLRSHPDDFMPFLTNDNGDFYTKNEFDVYCDRLLHEAVWGGQLEIQALSQAFQRPIHVVQSGSATIKIGQEFDQNEPLVVSYHRHAYGLGEHYNSLVPRLELNKQ